jgi:hypothetical protein
MPKTTTHTGPPKNANTRRTTSEIPEMRYYSADDVFGVPDKLYEIGVKLSFVTESAAFMTKNAALSEAGISGLWHILCGIQDDVLEAVRMMEENRTSKKGPTEVTQ